MRENRFELLLPNAIINDTVARKSYYLSEKDDVEKLVALLNGQQVTINEFSRELAKLLDKYDEKKKESKEQQSIIEAKNEYQRTLEAKIRRLKNRIKILEKAEGWQN